MDEIESAASDNWQVARDHTNSRSSGIKLVLPSLSSLKALKSKKKPGKHHVVESPVKKTPRPPKLKPVKEVLTKLIAQIKKKDDYAFFLTPVDTSQVPGYTDVVKHPMDFGTITTKVEKGKYRSLEEFASDVRLVTGNAKLFNPPGSIYYTEADRIEAYALSHISKAAATVIEYETDWNIDVEHEDERGPNEDGEDGKDGTHAQGSPMDVDGSVRGRSPSVVSAQPTGARRQGKPKKQPGQISESIEEDGHLPGHKDGLGQFPPNSDLAELMLALKLKGKRYRTKKERMRMEKGGPPYAADGSLDYPEMEDPFSVLSVFLPNPPSKPLLTPLYPTLPPTDPSEPPFPAPVSLDPDRPLPNIHVPPNNSTPSKQASSSKVKPKRRHWTINRSTASRYRARDREEDESNNAPPTWKTPREPHAVDWGTSAILVDRLAREMRVQDVGSGLGSAEKLNEVLRRSLEKDLGGDYKLTVEPEVSDKPWKEDYWQSRALQAEDYITDVVYGGLDGLAYVRSLAEFTQRPEDMEFHDGGTVHHALGKPLAKWVEQNVVDPVTGGRHRLLRETARCLNRPGTSLDPLVSNQANLSRNLYPRARRQLYELRQISRHKLDMAALIRSPNELFLADDEWAGAVYLNDQKAKMEEEKERALRESPEKNAADYLSFAIQAHREAEEEEQGPEENTKGKMKQHVPEKPEMLAYALNYSVDAIAQLSARRSKKRDRDTMEAEDRPDIPQCDEKAQQEDETQQSQEQEQGEPVQKKIKTDEEDEEEKMMHKLRMNLLALAKRAPLDLVARLPAELVPSHIRAFVPTITNGTTSQSSSS
ncbi:hypothetical protein K474DRAFT_1665959 [Panus rudis PR-1116 ss-1]|nr:hypothetical protein K474DRAFT_1665959 [Panus rudis PR-1116 ss-1]